jgi:RNA 2',3'-cyclic 3'-phosphodiesterase
VSEEPAKARLFAALEIPEPARAALHAWALPLGTREPALRVLPAESLHVTLVFLGWQAAGALEEIGAAVTAAGRALPELEVTGAAWLPPRRPGVLVADLAPEPTVMELQADLAAALGAFCEPEARPFRPHVTAARVRRGTRSGGHAVPEPPELRFVPAGVVLYRSHLGRGGAVYEAIARG